jgi:hypothetical protein
MDKNRSWHKHEYKLPKDAEGVVLHYEHTPKQVVIQWFTPPKIG